MQELNWKLENAAQKGMDGEKQVHRDWRCTDFALPSQLIAAGIQGVSSHTLCTGTFNYRNWES